MAKKIKLPTEFQVQAKMIKLAGLLHAERRETETPERVAIMPAGDGLSVVEFSFGGALRLVRYYFERKPTGPEFCVAKEFKGHGWAVLWGRYGWGEAFK